MRHEADFAITHQSEDWERSYLWSGWKRRHWPAWIIRPGLRLYGFDKKSRRFFVLLEISRGKAFEYENKQQFSVRILYGLGRWRVNASEEPRSERIGGYGQGFRR